MRKILPVLLLASPLPIAAVAVSVSCASQPTEQELADQKAKAAVEEAESATALFKDNNHDMDPYIKSRMKGDWLVAFLKKGKMDDDGVYFVPDDGTFGTQPAYDLALQTGYKPNYDYGLAFKDAPVWKNTELLYDYALAHASWLMFSNVVKMSLSYRSRVVDGEEKNGTAIELTPEIATKMDESVKEFNDFISEDPSNTDKVDELVQSKFGLFTSATVEIAVPLVEKVKTESYSTGVYIASHMNIKPYIYDDSYQDQSIFRLRGMKDKFSAPGDVAVFTAKFYDFSDSYEYDKKLSWLPDSRKTKGNIVLYQILFRIT